MDNFLSLFLGIPTLYRLLTSKKNSIRLLVTGSEILFYCTTQYIKLDMESKFNKIKKFSLINQLSLMPLKISSFCPFYQIKVIREDK